MSPQPRSPPGGRGKKMTRRKTSACKNREARGESKGRRNIGKKRRLMTHWFKTGCCYIYKIYHCASRKISDDKFLRKEPRGKMPRIRSHVHCVRGLVFEHYFIQF